MSLSHEETMLNYNIAIGFFSLLLLFCFFGMFKSCQQSSHFYDNCTKQGGVVKWGGKGGDDLCFSKDGKLINL
jgi:hypothetical protein